MNRTFSPDGEQVRIQRKFGTRCGRCLGERKWPRAGGKGGGSGGLEADLTGRWGLGMVGEGGGLVKSMADGGRGKGSADAKLTNMIELLVMLP